MPNHIINQITFGTSKEALAAFRKLMEFVKMDDSFLGSVDFNKLIPMPPSLEITAGSQTDDGLTAYKAFVQVYLLGRDPSEVDLLNIPPESEQAFLKMRTDIDPETWALGRTAFQNIQRYGYATWYGWSIENWGTKWNAYDCRPANEQTTTLQFNTAWSSVPDIIKLLSEKFPDQCLIYSWADEDIGMNVGELTFANGEIVEYDVPRGGSREAYELAAAIRGIDLADYDLYLTKDGSTYEYRESEDEPLPAEPVKPAPSKKSKSRNAR